VAAVPDDEAVPTPDERSRVDVAPPTLRAAVWLLTVEAVGAGGLAAVEAARLLTSRPERADFGVVLVGMLVGLTVLLVALARWLARRRRGARGPAAALHLFGLALAYYMLEAGVVLGSVLVLVVCFGGLGLLLAPPTTRALGLR